MDAEPLSLNFCLCCSAQVALVYAKSQGGLYSVPYLLLLLPAFLYFIVNTCVALAQLHSEASMTLEQATRALLYIFTQVLLLASIYFYAEMLDYDLKSHLPAAIPFALAIGSNLMCHIYNTTQHSNVWAAAINLLTPALSTCSTSGLCSSLYASTLTSFLSTFGISILDLNKYMLPLTVVLLGITLYSLYYTKRTVLYKPFLLGLCATVLICVSQAFDKSRLLIWSGNGMLLIAVIWNNHQAKYQSGELSPHKSI